MIMYTRIFFLERTHMSRSFLLCFCLMLLLQISPLQNVSVSKEENLVLESSSKQSKNIIVDDGSIVADSNNDSSESAVVALPSVQEDEAVVLENQPIEVLTLDNEEEDQKESQANPLIEETKLSLYISPMEYTGQVSTFSELRAAVDNIALTPGKKGTITIVGSFDFDETISVNNDIEVTLIGTNSKPVLGISKQSVQVGKFRHFVASGGGKLNASQLIFDGANVGGGVNIIAGGTASFSNVAIQNCVEPTNSNGGAIRAYSGTSSAPAIVSIDNCSLMNNSAKQGGALYAGQYATVDITNTDISENKSNESGGGVVLVGANTANPIKATFINVNFTENKAINSYSNGGGISITDYAEVMFEGCIFEENFTNLNGGGIFVDRYTNLTIKNCEFTSNECTNRYSSGGGIGSTIYNNANSGLDISNSVFTGNKANMGGGISLDNLEINTVTNCTITGNTAVSSGGGIYLGSSVSAAQPKPILLLSGSTVNQNMAVSGAGIFTGKYSTYGSKLSVLAGSKIIDNTASQDGGGIYTEDSSYETVYLSADTILNGNKAEGLYTLPVDSELIVTHASHVLTSSFSSPYVDYAYNNYDINYTTGPLAVVTSVVYDANGGVGSFTVQVGTSQTHLALSSDVTGITKQDSQFMGWCTTSDPTAPTAISYAVGDVVTLNQETSPLRLYAQWKDNPPSPSPSPTASSEPSPSKWKDDTLSPSPSPAVSPESSLPTGGNDKGTPNTGDDMVVLWKSAIAFVIIAIVIVFVLYKRKICKNS